MSTLSLAVRDSSTMLRRNLLHARRYPSLTLNLLLTPVMLLLLFVYVFGDVMSAGMGGGADRAAYVAYLVPGLLLMTIGSTVIGTAVSVANDMNEGIIARFRTMAIHRPSILVGHVVLFATALTWIAVGMGLVSPTAEAASNNALPLIFLPLISSTFVPVAQMPGWFQPIAEYQPFTPAIETLRGLLLGTGIGHHGWLAVAWCAGLAVLGYVWSAKTFAKDPR